VLDRAVLFTASRQLIASVRSKYELASVRTPRKRPASYADGPLDGSVVDAIDQGFCIIEVLFDEAGKPHDYRFLQVNAAFEKQTGIENAVGRRMREIAPNHETHWFEIYGRVAQTGESARFEAEAKALDRFYTVNAFRIGAPEQRRVGVLFEDISERKRLEQQLRESNRRKDEFLATLAHELRNPLAPITTTLALLRHPNNDVPVEQLYAVLDRQVHHMVRLVDDLLDLSRITRGVIELDKQPVELAEVLRRAIETSRPLIAARQCRLSVEDAPTPVLVDGDPTRLVQVVSNLLNNAAKYTQRGGHICATLGRDREWARLAVRDDGVGIPAEMLERVFEMFTQVDTSRTDGLGIGLTLVRSLVALHGGRVEVHSEGLGHGSEFIVHLPVVRSLNR
jgi:PAS domain S-box-containing protein